MIFLSRRETRTSTSTTSASKRTAWQVKQDDNGCTYYLNTVLRATTNEEPEYLKEQRELSAPAASAAGACASPSAVSCPTYQLILNSPVPRAPTYVAGSSFPPYDRSQQHRNNRGSFNISLQRDRGRDPRVAPKPVPTKGMNVGKCIVIQNAFNPVE